MKILFQVYDREDYAGGPVINMRRLIPEIKKAGHEVFVAVEYDVAHPNADYLASLGIPCGIFRRAALSRPNVRFYLEQLEIVQPDIFVSNVSTGAAFAGRWAREAGIAVIHTHRSEDDLNTGTAKYFFLGPKKWRLDALVCVSAYLKNQILNESESDVNIKVIPSGVPKSIYRSEQSTSDVLKVVYVGRIVQIQKRVLDMVDLFLETLNNDTNYEFGFIGSGDEYVIDQVEERINQSGFTDKFTFHARQTETKKYKQLLAQYHVIVLLSDYEGIPGAIMDGMSCGLVPVVTDITGIDELITNNENGIILKKREDIGHVLHRLRVDNKSRKELSDEAHKYINQKMNIQTATAKWLELFEELNLQRKPKFQAPRKFTLPNRSPLLVQHRPDKTFKEKIKSKLGKVISLLS